MFAYLVLLYDPKPHPLLAVEEPENQLYPELLYELIEEFRAYALRGGQVFVSTHSPDFLNGNGTFHILRHGRSYVAELVDFNKPEKKIMLMLFIDRMY